MKLCAAHVYSTMQIHHGIANQLRETAWNFGFKLEKT